MELATPSHSTVLFTVDKQHKILSTEMSTIEANCIGDCFGRAYDDACDPGFTLVSHVSEKRARFAMEAVSRNWQEDGEIVSWTLHPTQDTLKQHPQLRGWRVVVYND